MQLLALGQKIMYNNKEYIVSTIEKNGVTLITKSGAKLTVSKESIERLFKD